MLVHESIVKKHIQIYSDLYGGFNFCRAYITAFSRKYFGRLNSVYNLFLDPIGKSKNKFVQLILSLSINCKYDLVEFDKLKLLKPIVWVCGLWYLGSRAIVLSQIDELRMIQFNFFHRSEYNYDRFSMEMLNSKNHLQSWFDLRKV